MATKRRLSRLCIAVGQIVTVHRKRGGETTAKVLEREIEAAKKAKVPVHVLALGDLAYDGGTKREFKWCANSPATSPPRTVCFDIRSPLPGDSDVTSQVDLLNSYETKIAPRWVRIAAGAAGRSAATCMMVLQRAFG